MESERGAFVKLNSYFLFGDNEDRIAEELVMFNALSNYAYSLGL